MSSPSVKNAAVGDGVDSIPESITASATALDTFSGNEEGAAMVGSTALDATSSAATAVASSGVPTPDDPVVSVLFVVATIALSVVTLGVAYLSFDSWQSSRQESQDRLRSDRVVTSDGSMKKDKTAAKKGSPAPATSKGFGGKGSK